MNITKRGMAVKTLEKIKPKYTKYKLRSSCICTWIDDAVG